MAVDRADLVRDDAVHRELLLNPSMFAAEMGALTLFRCFESDRSGGRS